jgi:hypothetical protein
MIPTPTTQALGAGGMPLNLRPKAVPDGDRIIVGLIDTKVQGKDSPNAGFFLESLSVVGESSSSSDSLGHGPAMAQSILHGAASSTCPDRASRLRILPVDVYGNRSTTTTFDVAAGITEAVNRGAMIVNLSLGSEGNSTLLQQIIQDAHRQNVVFLAAAGNEPVTFPTYPAAYPEVIAVTAGDGSGNLAPYANRGSFVDVVGPGTVPVSFNGKLWRVTGTSPATAFIAGMAAGSADCQNLSWADVERLMRFGASANR